MNAITLTCDFNYGTAATLRHIVCVVQQCTMHRSAMHLHPNHSAGNVMGALLACAAALLLPRGVSCADNISHYDSIEDTKIYSIWTQAMYVPVYAVIPSPNTRADSGRRFTSSSYVPAIFCCSLIRSSNCCLICWRRYASMISLSALLHKLLLFKSRSALWQMSHLSNEPDQT